MAIKANFLFKDVRARVARDNERNVRIAIGRDGYGRALLWMAMN